MKNWKIISAVTWMVTAITAILWLSVLTMGLLTIKDYITQSNGMNIQVIGGTNGPISTSVSTFAFVGGVSDFVVLGMMLVITIILWSIRIKVKNKRNS